MADLVAIVPSRGRRHAVAEVVAAFSETCTANTILMFACDRDDPKIGEYHSEVERLAVLSAHKDQHRPEPESTVRPQLQCMDEQPPLPG